MQQVAAISSVAGIQIIKEMSMPTVKQAIIEVLQTAEKPLHVLEITKRVLPIASNLKGQTPQHTVNATLSTYPRFKRVAKGVYALSEWHEYKELRRVVDIAHDVLSGVDRQLSVAEITAQVLSERRLRGSPKSTVKQLLQKDSRFAEVAPGVIELAHRRSSDKCSQQGNEA